MAYILSLDGIPMPVTPSKIEMKIKNQNKTINLINGSEINLIKTPGLTEFSFELLIPQVKGYSFAYYSKDAINGDDPDTGVVSAKYYLDLFERLKLTKAPFKFIVSRTSPADKPLFDTFMNTTLEEYSVTEDSENGLDLMVSINLKQYREYSAWIYDGKQIYQKATGLKTVPEPYTVIQGDTLWSICKRYLNDGSKYPKIAALNGIKNPNLIFVGQVIRFG